MADSSSSSSSTPANEHLQRFVSLASPEALTALQSYLEAQSTTYASSGWYIAQEGHKDWRWHAANERSRADALVRLHDKLSTLRTMQSK